MRLYVIAFAALVFITLDVHAQEDGRGRLLHDTHCVSCHATGVYTRPDRVAGDYQQVRAEVDRWQRNVSLNWKDEDIDLVTDYIASRFYRFECPSKC